MKTNSRLGMIAVALATMIAVTAPAVARAPVAARAAAPAPTQPSPTAPACTGFDNLCTGSVYNTINIKLLIVNTYRALVGAPPVAAVID